MRRLTKKIAAAVLSLSLVLAVGTTTMGATWDSYFGANGDWYEGATGNLKVTSISAYTAQLDTVGWGGVYGCQVFLNQDTKAVNIKKGQKYTFNATLKSSTVTKFVYVKFGNSKIADEAAKLAYGVWVKCPAGQTVNVSKVFTAKTDADTLYMNMGCDFGDRVGSDGDAEIRYALLPNYQAELANDADGDAGATTTITMTNMSVVPVVNFTAKAAKKAVKVTVKKATTGVIGTVKGYQVQVGSKKVKGNKTSFTVKKLKSGKKVSVKVRAYGAGNKFGAWSKAKKVKVK